MLHELTSNPLFGLILSLGVFLLARELALKTQQSLLNPLIVSIVTVIVILKVSGISYEDYYKGGSILNMLIGPATVALAVPLYQSFHLLKRHARSILVGVLAGTLFSTFFTALFALVFHYHRDILASILPKSVTTAIAIEIAQKMNGIPTVTIIIVIVTGIAGAIFAPTVLKWAKVTEPVAKGIAIGSSAHAIGTSKAMEMGKVEGAMSGLAIGVAGVMTVFVAPAVYHLVSSLF